MDNRTWMGLIFVTAAVALAVGCANRPTPATYPYAGQVYSPPSANPVGNASGVPTAPAPATVGRPLPSIQRPKWGSPGSAEEQRRQAMVFDPYADNDAGPEIVGGRPREFQKPLAQPARATTFPGARTPF